MEVVHLFFTTLTEAMTFSFSWDGEYKVMVSRTEELSKVSAEHMTCRTVGWRSKADVFSPANKNKNPEKRNSEFATSSNFTLV